MKKQGRPSSISVVGIFNGFKCMADIDILKKVKQKTIILNENMDFSR